MSFEYELTRALSNTNVIHISHNIFAIVDMYRHIPGRLQKIGEKFRKALRDDASGKKRVFCVQLSFVLQYFSPGHSNKAGWPSGLRR